MEQSVFKSKQFLSIVTTKLIYVEQRPLSSGRWLATVSSIETFRFKDENDDDESSYQILEILERLRFTFTANGKRHTQVENFSE